MNLVNNEQLRTIITNRIQSVFESQAALINDANERKMPLNVSRLSKYLKGKKGGLTEEQVLWIAIRLGVYVNVNLGKPIIKEGKLYYEVTPYNELEALKRLNSIFKNG